jgi:hypothetical protein
MVAASHHQHRMWEQKHTAPQGTARAQSSAPWSQPKAILPTNGSGIASPTSHVGAETHTALQGTARAQSSAPRSQPKAIAYQQVVAASHHQHRVWWNENSDRTPGSARKSTTARIQYIERGGEATIPTRKASEKKTEGGI